MIAKCIKNSLYSASFKTLFSKRKHFTWTNVSSTASYDGPTILHLLISSVNPSTRVGVSDLKSLIRSARLMQFQYSIIDMCDSIMANYELIGERGGCHNDIILDLYDALLSGKNDVFNRFVERRKEDWKVGSDITHNALINLAVTKYHNMFEQNRWKLTDIKTFWYNDDGHKYEGILKGALFFPESPVNIISVTVLAAQFDNDNRTWIKPSRYSSTFTWDNGKFTKTLVHPTSRLPTLQVNYGYSTFTFFYTLLEDTGLVPRT